MRQVSTSLEIDRLGLISFLASQVKLRIYNQVDFYLLHRIPSAVHPSSVRWAVYDRTKPPEELA